MDHTLRGNNNLLNKDKQGTPYYPKNNQSGPQDPPAPVGSNKVWKNLKGGKTNKTKPRNPSSRTDSNANASRSPKLQNIFSRSNSLSQKSTSSSQSQIPSQDNTDADSRSKRPWKLFKPSTWRNPFQIFTNRSPHFSGFSTYNVLTAGKQLSSLSSSESGKSGDYRPRIPSFLNNNPGTPSKPLTSSNKSISSYNNPDILNSGDLRYNNAQTKLRKRKLIGPEEAYLRNNSSAEISTSDEGNPSSLNNNPGTPSKSLISSKGSISGNNSFDAIIEAETIEKQAKQLIVEIHKEIVAANTERNNLISGTINQIKQTVQPRPSANELQRQRLQYQLQRSEYFLLNPKRSTDRNYYLTDDGYNFGETSDDDENRQQFFVEEKQPGESFKNNQDNFSQSSARLLIEKNEDYNFSSPVAEKEFASQATQGNFSQTDETSSNVSQHSEKEQNIPTPLSSYKIIENDDNNALLVMINQDMHNEKDRCMPLIQRKNYLVEQRKMSREDAERIRLLLEKINKENAERCELALKSIANDVTEEYYDYSGRRLEEIGKANKDRIGLIRRIIERQSIDSPYQHHESQLRSPSLTNQISSHYFINNVNNKVQQEQDNEEDDQKYVRDYFVENVNENVDQSREGQQYSNEINTIMENYQQRSFDREQQAFDDFMYRINQFLGSLNATSPEPRRGNENLEKQDHFVSTSTNETENYNHIHPIYSKADDEQMVATGSNDNNEKESYVQNNNLHRVSADNWKKRFQQIEEENQRSLELMNSLLNEYDDGAVVAPKNDQRSSVDEDEPEEYEVYFTGKQTTSSKSGGSVVFESAHEEIPGNSTESEETESTANDDFQLVTPEEARRGVDWGGYSRNIHSTEI